MAINNNSNDTAVLYIALTAIISAITTTTFSGAASATAAESLCKLSTDMWGEMPIPIFFSICNERMAIALQCPEGRGFFNGYGYYGCIPYEVWPACISAGSMTQTCDSEHLLQPWQTVDPNKFFMCVAEALAPVLVSCVSREAAI